MNNSVETELKQYISERVFDLIGEDMNDLHHNLFNVDYYIIGYYQAEQWLKEHNISAFEAIAECIEWEQNNFGEINLKPNDINTERIANLLVFIYGEELLGDLYHITEKYDTITPEFCREIEAELAQ